MMVRVLDEGDWQVFRDLRLRGLQTDPAAFGASPEQYEELQAEDWASRLKPGESFVMGAFHGESLVGVSGFARERQAKLRHKGMVWGMYVAPEARGQSVGRRLLAALVGRAAQQEGLEQIGLTVVVTNQTARQLYLRAGFRPYGLEPRALKVGGRYLDEEHMVLLLERA